MLKVKTKKIISVQDWDDLVTDTYGRPYCFQQQNGCKGRQTVNIVVPCEPYDYENDTLPEVVNHPDMGVSFKAWLERDPKQLIPDDDTHRSESWKPTPEEIERMQQHSTSLWWDRNFYPHVSMIINDLHAKGLLEEGEYGIEIDW